MKFPENLIEKLKYEMWLKKKKKSTIRVSMSFPTWPMKIYPLILPSG